MDGQQADKTSEKTGTGGGGATCAGCGAAAGKPDSPAVRAVAMRRHLWVLLAVWTLFVGVVLLWSLLEERRETVETARIQARSAFEKDLAYRRWAAGHGGDGCVDIVDTINPEQCLRGVVMAPSHELGVAV